MHAKYQSSTPAWHLQPDRPKTRENPSELTSNSGGPANSIESGGLLPNARSARRTLAELVLSTKAETDIHAAIKRITHHKLIFDDWGLGEVSAKGTGVALNLFGPPGTGKTTCAEAIAHALGKRIVEANYAELESKYVGETPKNIVALFEAAHEADAVIFFDEADSILGKRLTSVTQSADHSVNVARSVLLKQLDTFPGIVIFATNLPGNYDRAFVRRIIAHIELALPDEQHRLRLWQRFVPSRMPIAADLDFGDLASRSVNMSGGDIINAIEIAAGTALHREGPNCTVSLLDFRASIEQIQNANEVIAIQS